MELEDQGDATRGDAEIAAIFDSLGARFKPGRLTTITTFFFSIDNESWTIAVGPDHCTVKEGEPPENADCSLKISKALFLTIFRGEYLPSMMDLISGKIKSNNPMLLAVLKDAFSG